jgi:molybdopterin synthase sulfur carrier subunit
VVEAADLTGASGQVRVTVRYFAAARSAARSESESVVVDSGVTVAELVKHLGQRDVRLASVLRRCSFLCDGVAVRNPALPLQSGQTIDVLPPFAGG